MVPMKMMLMLAAMLLLSSLTSAEKKARKQGDQRIVGGKKALISVFPWQVALRYKGENTAYCGATILNDRWIITAAHCFVSPNPDESVDPGDVEVVFNTDDLRRVQNKTTIDHVVFTDGQDIFNPSTLLNDIALIKTVGRLSTRPSNRISLVPANANFVGKDAIVTGFGDIRDGGPPSLSLLQVTLKVLPDRTCENYYVTKYGPDGYDRKVMLCTGYLKGGKDSCQGDSGGPLVVKSGGKYVLLGVVSFGDGCAIKGVPAAYTRVSYFRNFILTTIKQ